VELLNGSLYHGRQPNNWQERNIELIFTGFLGIKAKIKATFGYLSFTFKVELILQTMKESILKDREGRALPPELQLKLEEVL